MPSLLAQLAKVRGAEEQEVGGQAVLRKRPRETGQAGSHSCHVAKLRPLPTPSFQWPAPPSMLSSGPRVPEKPGMYYPPGKKGEWSLAPDKCLRLPPPTVQCLLHESSELKGERD